MKYWFPIMILVCAVSSAHSQTQTPMENPEFLSAQKLESQGQTAQALQIYRRLFENDPNDLYFWKLVTLYEPAGDWSGLEYAARVKLARQPDYLEARRYLSRALTGRGEQDEARKLLMSILDGQWDREELVSFVAGEFQSQGNIGDALGVFRNAREKSGGKTSFAGEMARLYMSQENYLDALIEYVSVLDKDNAAYGNCSQLIQLARQKGVEPSRISAPIIAFLKDHPENVAAARLAAGVMSESGDFEGAFRILKGPAAASGSFADEWRLAEAAGAGGSPALAVEIYDEFCRAFPKNPSCIQAKLKAAGLTDRIGKPDEARRRYQLVISDYAGTYEAAQATLRLLELTRRESGDDTYLKLLSEFAGSTTHREAAYEGYRMIGDACLYAGRTDDAKTAYTQAKLKAEANGEKYEISLRLAEQAYFNGDFDLMDPELRMAVTIMPDGPGINDMLARTVLLLNCSTPHDRDQYAALAKARYLLYQGEENQAESVLSAVVRDSTTVVAPHAAMVLGDFCRERSRIDDAITWYLAASSMTGDATFRAGALLAAGMLVETGSDATARARTLYIKALTENAGTVYDAELRSRLRKVTEQ
jgi:tetratricopeptide (TPR) repeat protein